MSPLRALRESLSQLPHAKENSSQAGFARLIGRSESLVRAVESGRALLSGKLARELSTRFGVPLDLLMKDQVDEKEMRAIQPSQACVEASSWRFQTESVAEMAKNPLIEEQVKRGPWFELDPQRRIRRKLISSVLIGMDDLFSICSDEELAVVTSELREWVYSRLAKMAKSEEPTEP